MLLYVLMYVCYRLFGVFGGIFSYLLAMQTIKGLLKRLFSLEMMDPNDEMFFGDDERSYGNIVAFHKYEKFDPEEFKWKLLNRSKIFSRLKSKIKKFLGFYMFEEMDDATYLEEVQNNVQIVNDIHTEEGLATYLSEIQCVREPLNALQWRIYLIPDYSETESIFIYKAHHCLSDGIAIILMFFVLNDDPDYKDFPPIMVRFPVMQEILITLGAPFIMAFYAI